MSEQLPEYTGEMACCFACDGAEAGTEYMPPLAGGARQMLDRRDPAGNPGPSGAFLKRTCMRCGYEWAEALVSRDTAIQQPQNQCDATNTGDSQCLSRYENIRCVQDVDHDGIHEGSRWIWTTREQDA